MDRASGLSEPAALTDEPVPSLMYASQNHIMADCKENVQFLNGMCICVCMSLHAKGVEGKVLVSSLPLGCSVQSSQEKAEGVSVQQCLFTG